MDNISQRQSLIENIRLSMRKLRFNNQIRNHVIQVSNNLNLIQLEILDAMLSNDIYNISYTFRTLLEGPINANNYTLILNQDFVNFINTVRMHLPFSLETNNVGDDSARSLMTYIIFIIEHAINFNLFKHFLFDHLNKKA